jgi:hypothetical protein
VPCWAAVALIWWNRFVHTRVDDGHPGGARPHCLAA